MTRKCHKETLFPSPTHQMKMIPKSFPSIESFSSTFVTRPMEMQSLLSKHLCNNMTFLRRKENLDSCRIFYLHY
jgi:hypothetical protein